MAKAPQQGLVDEIGGARRPAASAAPTAAPKAAADAAKKKRSPGFYYMMIALSLVTCVLFYETAILITVSMLPTGVAYVIDTHPRRYATKTVAWANLAGALIVTFDLWAGDRTLATAFDLMSDPFNWVIVLGAAGVGWGIHFMVPDMVLRYLDISLDLKRKGLHERQKTLEKEWGKEVRRDSPMEDLARAEAGKVDGDEEDDIDLPPEDDDEDEDPDAEMLKNSRID